jgi:RNA polymerase sigma-70 factor (ECF subfamily)
MSSIRSHHGPPVGQLGVEPGIYPNSRRTILLVLTDEFPLNSPSNPAMPDAVLTRSSVASTSVVVRASLAESDLEQFRRELTGYCYRMLGSGFEAEDAVQETMLRAWRNADTFEGRSSVRSWLYLIATNVCIDMQRQVQRRARPMEMGPASPPLESHLGPPLPETTWVTPIPDSQVLPERADPAEVAEYRESVRLAFVAALQHLPARQRAALILCEVLRWQASEAAELLETSVAAVNSAIQRARATLGSLPQDAHAPQLDDADAALLERYVDAFERYDIQRLVTLLHDDAVMSMPPFAMWIRGNESIGHWMLEPGPSACRGSRLLPISANGCPGFGQYKPDPAGGYAPWAIQVLEISGGKVSGSNYFLDMLDPQRLFPEFGLPLHLDGPDHLDG